MTKDLQDYLLANQFPFSDHEITEAIIMAYNLIEWGIRDQCPILEVSANVINRKYQEDGPIFKEFLTVVDFRPTFDLIVIQDKIIKKHLKLLSKAETKSTYLIS